MVKHLEESRKKKARLYFKKLYKYALDQRPFSYFIVEKKS